MKLVKPYIDENKQVIFIEIDEKWRHEVINGMLFGMLCAIPIYLII